MKNKWVKIIILGIFGIVLFVAGVVLDGGVGDLGKEFKVSNVDSSLVKLEAKEVYLHASEIKNLEVNVYRSNFSLNSENEKIYDAAWSGMGDACIKNGDTLCIGCIEGIDYTFETPVKTLTVSAKELGKVIGNESVAIKVPDGVFFDNVTINAEGSKVEIDSLYANEVNIKNTSGEVKVASLGAVKVDISNTSGDVEIEKADVSTVCKINTGSGDISIGEDDSESVIYGLNAVSNSGDIDIAGLLKGDCTVDGDGGDIELELVGSKSSYTLYPSTEIEYGSGSGTSDGTESNGVITIVGRSGGIKVDFK